MTRRPRRAAGGQPIRQTLAWCAVGALGGLAVTGIGWMLINPSISPEDFESPLRLWRHRVLVSHGIFAYGFLWLAGGLLYRHQLPRWRHGRRRLSGGMMAAALLALALTALALYYPPDEDARTWLSLLHQGIGISLLPAIAGHLLQRTRRAPQVGPRPA